MYQYVYDAKTKEKLPYWDAFPLIVCINVYADGWLGLNLHYLPPILRAKLLDKLMEYSKTIRTGGNGKRTYMHLSYKMLSRLSQVPFFQHCIKRYLASHVQSKIMRVNSSFWEEVAFLPTQQFKKAPDSTVWKDARRYK
jgi:gp2 DNA end protector protein